MSWRQQQLNGTLCNQDQLILDLFKNQPVKYHSDDKEFAKHLIISEHSSNLILILNRPMWCSDMISVCYNHLTEKIDTFYIGINRYHVLGNDTTLELPCSKNYGQDIIDFLTSIVNTLGYNISRSGTFDNDQGKYFNFIQPLTWMYGSKKPSTI